MTISLAVPSLHDGTGRELTPRRSRASYTLTQADVDAGTFTNTATVTGTPPIGDQTSPTPTTTPSRSGPGPGRSFCSRRHVPWIWTLRHRTAFSDAGETITYAFTVTNDGQRDADQRDTGRYGWRRDHQSGGPIATLAPERESDTTTFTGSYTLTQADVDAGTFTNTATVTGTPPIWTKRHRPRRRHPADRTGPGPGRSFWLKTGTISNDEGGERHSANVGDTISYAFTVTNDGQRDADQRDTGRYGWRRDHQSGGPIATLAPERELTPRRSLAATR